MSLNKITPFYSTPYGKAYLDDSRKILKKISSNSINLVITSPPFALTRKKEYDNVNPNEYIEWFSDFAIEIYRILKDDGSFILDLGGSWEKGNPIKNLYQFRLLIHLVDTIQFKLAQDIYWYNPAKLPTPAQWVAIKRIRLKDAVNNIWWLSKTNYPYSNNTKILNNYSNSMKDLLQNGYKADKRPSGHIISKKFQKDNNGSIPSNFLPIANTASVDPYLKKCKLLGLKPHPARFPKKIPEIFIKFLTKQNDVILDPFCGSNVVGEVAEELARQWIGIEIKEDYLISSKIRFNLL